MKIKKIIAIAAASSMLCAFASCSKKVKTDPAVDDKTSKSVPADLAGVDFEDTVVAGNGDAYLAIADKDFKMQYLGVVNKQIASVYIVGLIFYHDRPASVGNKNHFEKMMGMRLFTPPTVLIKRADI